MAGRQAWHPVSSGLKKLHVGLERGTGRIVAATRTDHNVGDACQVGCLLDQIDSPLGTFVADGAYEQSGVYAVVDERHPGAAVVVPPRFTVVPSDAAQTESTQRDRHLMAVADGSRMA